jgi:uracil-DNA glycosylase
MHYSWNSQLKDEFEKPYFQELMTFVNQEYIQNSCCPKKEVIYAAFDHCTFENTKIVILGQDPYHGPNQANGLSFSVQDGVKHPPSLVNIFKELQSDVDKPYPESGNLEHWATQGILLLNATLTVRSHEAGSHQKKGWETFTDAIIKTLSDEKDGLVFLLWGGYAKNKAKLIDDSKHRVILLL